MLKIVCSLLFVVCSCVGFAQVAEKLPDTLSTKKIVGSYITDRNGVISKVTIKRDHSYSLSVRNSMGKESMFNISKGEWKIANDTLFFLASEAKNYTIKLVMHNGSLHFIRKDGTSDPSALMTKKDYKYYQRQCRKAGK